MNTEHAEDSINSSVAQIAQSSATQKSVDTTSSDRGAQSHINHKWGWQDVLYLLILLGLVAAMAYHYTPDITAEVAGEWWDPLLNMWTLSWNTTTLLHDPAHLWQAQLLYPNNLTLSYSENLLGETVFFAPLFLLSHNPVLSYNLVFYLTFLLCGVNMYILARYHTGKSFAAFVAGLIYAFSPYRLGQIDHIHIIAGAWMPLALLYLNRSLTQGRWRHWSLFALFYLLQLLSSIYYGIFFTYTVLTYVLIRYTRSFIIQWRQQGHKYFLSLLKQAVKPLVVFSMTLVILAILMAPYLLSLSSGLARSLGQSATFSAYIIDFTFTAPFNLLHGVTIYNGVSFPYDSEHYLFLGWAALALAVLGIVLALQRRSRIMRAYLWTGVIILLFAFGPFLQLSTATGTPLIPQSHVSTPIDPPGWPMPWYLAYFILPGFKGLRVPARLVGVLLIMVALLAAHGLAWLEDTLRKETKSRALEKMRIFHRLSLPVHWRTLVLCCAIILIPLSVVLEGTPAYLPITSVPTGDHIPAVYQWLATHGGQQPILELPMAHLDENFTTKDEAWYDYYAIYHPHPIVNGWSGYRPPLTTHIAELMLDFPSRASLSILQQYHIHYVILHLQLYQPNAAAVLRSRVEASKDLQLVAEFNNDLVWQVR